MAIEMLKMAKRLRGAPFDDAVVATADDIAAG